MFCSFGDIERAMLITLWERALKEDRMGVMAAFLKHMNWTEDQFIEHVEAVKAINERIASRT